MADIFEYFEANINYNTIKKMSADEAMYQILHSIGCEYVYIVFNPANKLYKIGITNDFERRFAALKNQSGCEMRGVFLLELCTWESPSAKSHEKVLHGFFKHKRNLGEWFNLSLRDLVQIRDLFFNITANDFIELYKLDKN